MEDYLFVVIYCGAALSTGSTGTVEFTGKIAIVNPSDPTSLPALKDAKLTFKYTV
jgi:hypothetical protein